MPEEIPERVVLKRIKSEDRPRPRPLPAPYQEDVKRILNAIKEGYDPSLPLEERQKYVTAALQRFRGK